MKLNDIPPAQLKEIMWDKSTLLWAVDNAITTEKGTPLEFSDRPWLKEIFDDYTPIQATRKSSQIAWSTTMIIKTLKAAKYFGWNIIYTLPTFSDVTQFVTSKVNSIINNSPVITDWVKDKDSILQKKVGKGFIYYRGTFSKKTEKEKMESGTGIMLSSDLNVHDECDRSDQTILEQYESRLDASAYGGRWFFSNPSRPKTLGDRIYEESDQKHWFVKCSHCNKWQYLDYYKCIDRERKMYLCEKCGKEITAEDIRQGRWVKKYSNRDISGYWVNHMMCPWKNPGKLIDMEAKSSKQYFMNFVLGLPYIGSDDVVNKDLILKCLDHNEPNFLKDNCIGVDQGLKKHYVIGNKQGIFKVGVVDSWDEIEKLMKTYDVGSAVFDALPDLTAPRKIRDKWGGIVWLCYFKKEIQKAEFISWDDKTHTVYADRSKIIQQTIDRFLERKIRIQAKGEIMDEYIRHWEALYKTVEKDRMGIEHDIWESTGADHFAFASLYWQIAMEKSGAGKIKVWSGLKEKTDNGNLPSIEEILKNNRELNN